MSTSIRNVNVCKRYVEIRWLSPLFVLHSYSSYNCLGAKVYKTDPFQNAILTLYTITWHVAWCERYIVITVSYNSTHSSFTYDCYHELFLDKERLYCLTGVLSVVRCNMALTKSNLGLGNSMNFFSLVISIVTLLLLLAGFVRIEFKLNDQDVKLAAVERLCRAQTDVSQDDAAGVEGKTDDLCRCVLASQSFTKFS